MLAARITLRHFSVSLSMSLANSVGEPERFASDLGNPRLHPGISDHYADLAVELGGNFIRRVLRCRGAGHLDSLEAHQKIADGRVVRKRRPPFRTRHRQRAQVAGANEFD
jgi:hypothetical protein